MDDKIQIAELQTAVQRLQNNKQDKSVQAFGAPPLDSEGSDGDTIYKLIDDKGLMMFYKFSGTWYSTPLNIGMWDLQETINQTVNEIEIVTQSIDNTTISGTLSIGDSGTFSLSANSTVTGFSHSDLDDVGSGGGLTGNVHTQYALVNSFDSDTLSFTSSQVGSDITTGAVDVKKKNTSIGSDGTGIFVNEAGHSFSLGKQLTLTDTSDEPLKISTPLEWKIELIDTSSGTASSYIGSSNEGDLQLKPVVGKKVTINADNNSSNSGIGSSSYASGWGGSGWTIDRPTAGFSANEWMLEVDNLSVRGTLSVYELLIQQIRATNGSVFVTSCAKVFKVIDSDTLAFEDPTGTGLVPFNVNDIILCQKVNPGNTVDAYSDDATNFVKRLIYKVTAVSNTTIGGTNYGTVDIAAVSDAPGLTGSPAPGDDFVRIGSTTDAARRSSILLTSDFANGPFIDINDGVMSWDTWESSNKLKARLGNLSGVSDNDMGSLTGIYGLYSDSAYLKGKIVAESGYIGTSNAGWAIDEWGISSTSAGRKIYLGSSSAYENANAWFLVESYDAGGGNGVQGRLSISDAFSVDSNTNTVKLKNDSDNYIEINATNTKFVNNAVDMLTIDNSNNEVIFGNNHATDGTHPGSYLRIAAGSIFVYNEHDAWVTIQNNSGNPKLTVGHIANSKSFLSIDENGNLYLKNKDAGGTTSTAVSITNTGDATFKGSITLPDNTNVNSNPYQKLSTLTADSPSGSGLYMDATKLGYYNGSAWTSYLANTGDFVLQDANGSVGLSYTTSSGALTVNGSGTFSGAITASSGDISGNIDCSGSINVTHGSGDVTIISGNEISRRGYPYPIHIYSGFHMGGPLTTNSGNEDISANSTWYYRQASTGTAKVQHQIKGNRISAFWNYSETTVPTGRKLVWQFVPTVSVFGKGHTHGGTTSDLYINPYMWYHNTDDSGVVDSAHASWKYDSLFLFQSSWYDAGYNANYGLPTDLGYRWGISGSDRYYNAWIFGTWMAQRAAGEHSAPSGEWISHGEISAGSSLNNVWLVSARGHQDGQEGWQSHCFGGVINIWETEA